MARKPPAQPQGAKPAKSLDLSHGPDTEIALAALREVAADSEAPAAARAQAARTLLEVRGQLGRHAAPPPAASAPLATLSRAELQAELGRVRGAAAAAPGRKP